MWEERGECVWESRRVRKGLPIWHHDMAGSWWVAGERTRPTRQTGTLHDSCGVPGPCAPCSGAFDIRALRTA